MFGSVPRAGSGNAPLSRSVLDGGIKAFFVKKGRVMSLPLSSLRVAGGFVFLTGQGGFGADHELVDGGVAAETAQIFHNVAALLESVGASLDDVVSCLVHLADLDEYAAFNAEYAKHFPHEKPVRTTVRADLVAGMRVEITVVATQP